MSRNPSVRACPTPCALPRPAPRVRRPVVAAIDPSPLRNLVTLSLRCFRIEAVTVGQPADMFDALATYGGALVLGRTFAGTSADRWLAMIRTAGCRAPAVVIGAAALDVTAMAPVIVVRDPWGHRWARSWVEALTTRALYC